MPFLLSLSQLTWGALLLAGLVLLAAGSWMLIQRREEEWKVLARKLGLAFSHDEEGPRIQGTYRSRAVEISIPPESSDASGPVVVAVVAVGLRNAPAGMIAEATPGLVGEISNLAEEHAVTGDDDFDRNVHLRADNESAAVSYWTPERRRVFLNLVEQQGEERLQIADGRLSVELRGLLNDHREIRAWLDRLIAAAQELDASAESVS